MNRSTIFIFMTVLWVTLDFIFSTEVKASLIGSMAAGCALFVHWANCAIGGRK